MKELFILRRKNEDTEYDKYSYFIKTTLTGLELTTPFKYKATRFKEGHSIDVVSKDWKPVIVKN
jgi:hypothetical protein